MKIIQKKIEDLIPYEFNNKIHWEQQINQIANSIKEFWFTQPIVIDKNNINKYESDQFLYDSQKKKNDINIINNPHRNSNNNNRIDIKNEIRKKNCNLQISHQFIFSSPRIIKKPKKIFECSGSTIATNSSFKAATKKRRFRKNNDQLKLLKKFYNEHKYWSKTQIKEISQNIGLKENKVYKWLWDQRNKEIKATKFVVKKGNNS